MQSTMTPPLTESPPQANQLCGLRVTGMTCTGCARSVEKRLRAVEGVTDVQVNFAAERAQVHFAVGATTEQALVDAVKAGGYDATVETDSPRKEESSDSVWPVVLAGLLTAPLLLPMLLMPFGIHWMVPGELQLLLAAPVQFIVGARFYRGAFFALSNRTGNMDLLVAVGTSAAFFLSLASLDTPGAPLYFEGSAAVITFVLLGKTLEARAKRKTKDSIEELLSLQPEVALVLRDDQETEVPVSEVRVGEVLLVRSGAKIPVDGEVIEGESELDLSLLTGESLPVGTGPGNTVPAGGINGSGLLKVRATRLAKDSALARIIDAVEQVTSKRAPAQRLVDKISAIFVPALFAIAAVTFVGWTLIGAAWQEATVTAVAVLVIACPCALGLAVPTALMVGTGVAARHGILIRDPEAVELAGKVNVVVFDKTGTLTVGKPELTSLHPQDCTREDALLLAASAQQGSQHPLGKAMVAEAKKEALHLKATSHFSERPGKGVSATVDGRSLLVGSTDFMKEQGATLEDWNAAHEEAVASGASVVWLAELNRAQEQIPNVLALFAFADTPRPGAAAAVAQLKARGVQVVLLSGDHEAAAKTIAAQLGIEEVLANQLPTDKANSVQKLRKKGNVVAMVGDGVNDAPALATADLGLAMSSGTDVAMSTAGLTLVRAEPTLVGAALDISSKLKQTIAQNLFWAFCYNTAAIPLAALGYLTPTVAGFAMALSSLSVVGNSLRLRAWKSPAQ